MAHFTLFTIKGILLICSLNSATKSLEIKGQLPEVSVINHFLETYVKPYVQTIFAKENQPTFRSSKYRYDITATAPRNRREPVVRATKDERTIKETIDAKVAELKPLLQDGDEIEAVENVTLEGNDETTIIEFLPAIGRSKDIGIATNGAKPDAFRTNIQKYKKMQNRIKKMLHREPVSNDTRTTIINTFDEILAQLIGNQCSWKTADDHGNWRQQNQLYQSISKMHNLSNDQWSKMRAHYVSFLQSKLMQEESFLDMFHEFFSKIVDSTTSLSKRYKINCQLIELQNDKPSAPRFNAYVGNTDCANFKLCTQELKEFMNDFYNHLNDTTVSAFKNYAAMYARDVNMDVDLDKDEVVSLVDSIGDVAGTKVMKTFKKQTKKLVLDANKDRHANIKHIRDYVINTLRHTKKQLKKQTGIVLKPLTTKLYLTIKDDLDVNIDVDIGNLERSMLDRICSLFVLCNGRYASRRQMMKSHNTNVKDNNSVYVKVQLTIDDELRMSIAKYKSNFINMLVNNTNPVKPVRKSNIYKDMFTNRTVTRTTTGISDVKTSTIPLANSTIVLMPNVTVRNETHLNEV